ncbi:MAG: DUF4097 family beta strand repeat protein [Clostridia bacterium]|nr:DUF4097 family beta strand repeat protein [Clostridia bacterium]
MSKSVKICLAVAALFVVIGLILFAFVMEKLGWDFTRLSTVKYASNTLEVTEEFDKISIDVNTADIEFIPTSDGYCTIVCFEDERVKHSATVKNGTLVIDTTDTRKWYEYIGISVGTPKMTVYLPKNEYASLLIENNTGDINLPKDFSFKTIKIEGDTSDVDCFASASDVIEIEVDTGDINADSVTAGRLKLTTATGDIKINSVTITNGIEIETNTGSVKMNGASGTSLFALSDTGDVTLKQVIVTDKLSIESDTGDVRLESSDAGEITVKTSTGDVMGTLLSEKIFITESSTGKISVPKSITGGKCEITTSTGDIEINVRH